MTKHTLPFLAAGLAVVLLGAGTRAGAEQASTADTRLREAYRNATTQLRTAQNDAAAALAAKAELEIKNKDLEAKVKLLTKNGADDRDAAKKSIDTLKAQLESAQEQIAQLKKYLEKTQADFKAAATLAQSKEAERAKLAADVIVLTRTVADQKTKNAEMYKLGRDILLRYEKFGLGEVLGAREPFVGTTRVKLESFVQDFQDKLTDQKIKAEEKPKR